MRTANFADRKFWFCRPDQNRLFCRRPEKIPQIKMRTGPLFLLRTGNRSTKLRNFFFLFFFRPFFNGLQIIYGNSWYTKLRTGNFAFSLNNNLVLEKRLYTYQCRNLVPKETSRDGQREKALFGDPQQTVRKNFDFKSSTQAKIGVDFLLYKLYNNIFHSIRYCVYVGTFFLNQLSINKLIDRTNLESKYTLK